MIKRASMVLGLMLALAITCPAVAQIQGQRGEVSNGEVQLEVVLEDVYTTAPVRLSGLGDVNFGPVATMTATSPIVRRVSFCARNLGPNFGLSVERVSNTDRGRGLKLFGPNGDALPVMTTYRLGSGPEIVLEDGVILLGQMTQTSPDQDQGCEHYTSLSSGVRGVITYALIDVDGKHDIAQGDYRATFQWLMISQ